MSGSKLDPIATEIRERTGGSTVFVAVLGGPLQGFTIQSADPANFEKVPGILREVAANIERDIELRNAASARKAPVTTGGKA